PSPVTNIYSVPALKPGTKTANSPSPSDCIGSTRGGSSQRNSLTESSFGAHRRKATPDGVTLAPNRSAHRSFVTPHSPPTPPEGARTLLPTAARGSHFA